MQDDNIQSSEPKKSSKAMKWVLVILLVVAVGVAGYFGYIKYKQQNNQLAEKQSQITSLQADKAKLEADKKAAEEATSADNNFLVIKELGIKIKPGADLSDLSYYVKGSTAYFSTRSLMNTAAKQNVDNSDNEFLKQLCSPTSGPLGAITVYKSKAEIPQASGPAVQKEVGKVIVGYTPPQSTCSENKTAQELQTKQIAAMKTVTNTVELSD